MLPHRLQANPHRELELSPPARLRLGQMEQRELGKSGRRMLVDREHPGEVRFRVREIGCALATCAERAALDLASRQFDQHAEGREARLSCGPRQRKKGAVEALSRVLLEHGESHLRAALGFVSSETTS
jgi:hypothetical protein